MKILTGLLSVFLSTTCVASGVLSDSDLEQARVLQESALSDNLAWELVESLTTEVGPRTGGSAADALAVTWAKDKMTELGFDRVWLEPVRFPLWRRGFESASVIEPREQVLSVTALGGSPGTGGIIEADIVEFDSVDELEQAEPQSISGKIVFLSRRMERHRDGSGYGDTVVNRSKGPFAAAEKGAVALLIRSVGTGSERLPHTGMMSDSDQRNRVPAAAISQPDADLLSAMLSRGKPVRLRLSLDCGFEGETVSSNVIGEYSGTDPQSGAILLGAHLDSWDLGTGAIDDGTGVAITLAAAHRVASMKQKPARSIRVVLYANEEQGVYGGKAYAEAHSDELEQHLLGAESDLGSGRIYAFKTRTAESAEPLLAQLTSLLEPLGIKRDHSEPASGGADVGQMRKIGLPVIDLNQDASRYFDWHHTANDTLDKVDPADLRQNVAAWVTLVWAVTRSQADFGPVPVSD